MLIIPPVEVQKTSNRFAKHLHNFAKRFTMFSRNEGEGAHCVDYLSVSEAAELWGVSARRVQQLCKSNRIDGAKIEGRSWLIPAQSSMVFREKKQEYSDRLPLPVGISGYIEAVTKYYYIDKTLLIKDFIDTLPKVSLFTRPRRFGKTLNMDMLRVFFERTKADTSVYFKDKTVWDGGPYYRSFQGKYPVIYMSFKDVKYAAWDNMLKAIAADIRSEFARHYELADSAACNSVEKRYFSAIIDGTADEVALSGSLSVLSAMLHKHYGTAAVIIIDEYDTPIQQGYENGFYDQVVGFIRNLFSGAFKDNPNLAYGFLTGILRVAKESIFSGMNNLKVNTVLDDRFSQYFGFSREEVERLLKYYGCSDKLSEVCEWYDGYQFGRSRIFNPWSVINYVDESCIPKAFWLSTGSNEVIGDVIASASPEITENLRRLMQGETVLSYIDSSVIYPEIKNNPSGIYSFLLVAGYLRCTEIISQDDGNFMCRVSIPNKEIAYVYAKEIISRSNIANAESTAAAFRRAVYEKDVISLQKVIERYLTDTVSSFDTGSEAFYQGLMIGLCAIMNNRYTVLSNRESGLGRFDIQLMPVDKKLPGFILELKAARKNSDDLGKLAASALKQIDEMKYDTEMRNEGIDDRIKLGIAFYGKRIVITGTADI